MSNPIPFRGFDERGDVKIYDAGDLPHWRQDGCTYFVTLRLADALPQSVVFKLKEERHCWLTGNGIVPSAADWKSQFAKLSPNKQREFERPIAKNLNFQLDCGLGCCALREKEPMQLKAFALEFFHGKRVWTVDDVVMPNHVYVLLMPTKGYECERVLKSIKGYSAKEVNRSLRTNGTLLQRESYDHIVRDVNQLERFQKYIRVNPEKATLKQRDYRLSEEAIYELA